MEVKDLFLKVKEKAEAFGMCAKNDSKTITNAKGNAIVRYNIDKEGYSNGKAYFGFVGPEEETSGAYSDLSFVIFPEETVKTTSVSVFG